MTKNRLLKALLLCPLFMLFMNAAWAQNKTITGKVTDEKGNPVQGASITVKGSKSGTTSNASGSFTLSVQSTATTLVVSYVGYGTQEVAIGNGEISVSLKPDASSLSDVVVVGYGTAKKKDLTGAVASVKAKDFNQGVQVSPDQLIQGKVAGVQVINNSGQPGGATTFKIRGNSSLRIGNNPLFVVDGVILDGASARPGLNVSNLGQTPDANPLNFINPNDIASIDILKDASATAIYGSRGANGVVIITTKRGQSGTPKLDAGSSVGISTIAKKIEILNADQYKQELSSYGLTSGDQGGSADTYDAIYQTAITNNQNVALSAGNENARYRLSTGYLNQEGILLNTSFKKLTASLNSSFKFLNSKKLGVDFNITTAQTNENIGAISNNAGFTGNVISTALQWNPTRNLRKDDGSINNYVDGSTINPLELIEGYSDKARVTSVLGSVSPSYKFTNWLEYKLIYGFNYSTGERRNSIRNWVNIQGNGIDGDHPNGRGTAFVGNNQLISQTVTQTLNFDKQLSTDVKLGVLAGYEYYRKDFKGTSLTGQDYTGVPDGLDYTNFLEVGTNSSKRFFSFYDPVQEIRSYFGRGIINYQDKYLLTATFRADGSSKFGSNNRYGYFPSFAAAWNISNEAFMKEITFVNSLKLRGGWGITGNQEFPSGASLQKYILSDNNGGASENQLPNADLKWQEDRQTNVGIDFTIMSNRISGSIDYFSRTTKNLLFPSVSAQPSPGTTKWINLDGQIENKGVEITINANLVKNRDFSWDLGANATFVKNNVSGLPAPIITGELNGQGMSQTNVQLITNDQPINVFYTRDFQGFDKDGQAVYANDGNTFYFKGDPNPRTILGISTGLTYKKLSLNANMNGAMGFYIYNNTLNSVLPIGNVGSRNIATSIFQNGESLTNPITSSSRYLEKGNYLKMANLTLNYRVGDVGNTFKGINVFVTGQNLFVLTNYSGFDPEVNTDKQVNGVPSVGIDYIGYPAARTFLFGVNFSL